MILRLLSSVVTVAVAAVALLAQAGCGGGGGEEAGTEVLATTGILADITAQVAGEDAEVAQLIPDSADPHSFSLSAEDRLELERADLVVANGAGLEAGVPLAESGAALWELTANAGELIVDESGAEDPHVWMDPVRVASALPSLAAALGEADPAHARDYERRASDYADELLEVDQEISMALSEPGGRERRLVTSHDALAYFADRYRFDVLATAFPASGAEAEASAEQLAEVEAAVRTSGVRTVFAEQGDDPEVLEIVAAETGAAVEPGLLVESPGAAGGYAEMLRRDAQLIEQGLRG